MAQKRQRSPRVRGEYYLYTSCVNGAAKLDRSKLKEVARYQIEKVEKTIGKNTSVAIGLLGGKRENYFLLQAEYRIQ